MGVNTIEELEKLAAKPANSLSSRQLTIVRKYQHSLQRLRVLKDKINRVDGMITEHKEEKELLHKKVEEINAKIQSFINND